MIHFRLDQEATLWVTRRLNIEGNDYVFTFKLENQQITVNGQLFNPDMLP